MPPVMLASCSKSLLRPLQQLGGDGQFHGLPQHRRYTGLSLQINNRGASAAVQVPNAKAGWRFEPKAAGAQLRPAYAGHGLPFSLNITPALTTKTPHPNPLAIEVRGLRKSYGSVEAVRGIDLQVSTGEVFALLGPNGAGRPQPLRYWRAIWTGPPGTFRFWGTIQVETTAA